MKENAEVITHDSFANCIQVGSDLGSMEPAKIALISKANEVMTQLTKEDKLNFSQDPTLEGFIDFSFHNMYDGCLSPLFDTYGINNPCPNQSERLEIGKLIEKSAEE